MQHGIRSADDESLKGFFSLFENEKLETIPLSILFGFGGCLRIFSQAFVDHVSIKGKKSLTKTNKQLD